MSAQDFSIRRATPDDYLSFSRLFPELLVDDPVPGPEVWASTCLPSTWVAVRAAEMLGYCYCQKYAESGYVRNVVVAPIARRAGVGRALMQATADELRSHGSSSWRLNVKATNHAALALYARMGMQQKYRSCSFRLSWSALTALPGGDALARPLIDARDATLEALFDLPGGQLASARSLGRSLLEAITPNGDAPLGLAVFDPKFPGAFPFRVTELRAVTPLLQAMRQLVPTDDYVNLVAEDDERLVALLESVGADLRHEIAHMVGAL
jgi:GNAT superfamily N-acetyltransferase